MTSTDFSANLSVNRTRRDSSANVNLTYAEETVESIAEALPRLVLCEDHDDDVKALNHLNVHSLDITKAYHTPPLSEHIQSPYTGWNYDKRHG